MVSRSALIWSLVCCATARTAASGDAASFPTQWLQDYEGASKALGFGTQSWLPGPPAGNTGPYITNAALPSIGNGFIGTQWLSPVLYISGLFSGSPTTASQPGGTAVHRAAVPSAASVSICDAVSVATALDYSYATVEQRVTTSRHPGVEVTHRAYAHRTRKELLVVEFDVTGVSANAPIELCDQPFEEITQGQVPPGWSSPTESDLKFMVSTASQLPSAEAITAQLMHGDAQTSNLTRVAICRDAVPRNISTNGVTQLMATYVVGGNGSSATDLVSQACGLLAEARQDARSAKLLASHQQAWNVLWGRGVQIGGSSALARMVNSTHYGYLVALRDDVDYSTGPGGLSTNGYNGHVFWDMDTWIFPALNLFHPQLGDSHLRFRKRGMVGAAALALQQNQSGLMYPWEATPNGYSANNGGMARSEPHVTGDVAVAFWNRWRATHDLQFLRTDAWPVIAGVADFWAHRLTCPADTHQPCWIKCVSGPDEFHMCKDREVFTTALASTVFQIAVRTAKLLKVEGHGERIKLWESIAQRLSLDLIAPPQGHPWDPNITKCYDGYAGEAVMQPSVADVGYPLMFAGPGQAGEPLNKTQRKIDLDFYWRRTSGFIAGMVWPSVSIGYNEVNDTANAALFFSWAYSTVQPPFNVMSEEPGGVGCPNFLTGAGGVLSAVWAGWGGVRLRDDRLDLVYPIPPPGATSMRLARLHSHHKIMLECGHYFENGWMEDLGRLLQVDIAIDHAATSGNSPWAPTRVSVTLLADTDTRGFAPAKSLKLVCDGGTAIDLAEGATRTCANPALVSIKPTSAAAQ